MSEETLLTAARRAVRFFNIDQSHGGLVSVETIQAIEILDIEVHKEMVARGERAGPPRLVPNAEGGA